MSGRGTVNRVVQVGVETTSGTAVPANKSLPSTSMVITPVLRTKEVRAQGFKSATGVQVLGQYSDVAIAAPLNYTEIVYLFNMIVVGTITTPGGGTLSRKHVFAPVAQGTDTRKTLTIQEGDATAATQMAGSFLEAWGFVASDAGLELTGTLHGQAATVTTLTASPTSVAQQLISPREVDIYIDPTFGAIGTTKVTDASRLEYGLTSFQAMKWVLNTSSTSFKEAIDVVPGQTFSFTTEHNAQSRTLYAGIASGNPLQYMRFKATGPIIEGAIPYSFQFDVPVKITATAQEDADGVWGYKYDCVPTYDSAFGNKLYQVEVVNTIAAL